MTLTQPIFSEVVGLIKQARVRALSSVNKELINLYWNIGEYISKRVESEQWGKSVVQELAKFIQTTEPDIKGFSDKNLWRMKQFYESHKDFPKLSALPRELSWTNNTIIVSRCKTIQEKQFYLNLCIQEKYSSRELERQINPCVYERKMLSNQKLSEVRKVLPQEIINTFQDSYVFEFLNLSENHSESDLQKALINQMKKLVTELGKDFLFVGSEYKLQVGNSDFFIDLLFYHRGLQSLVAFELKIDKFKPEYLGQLNFYLEALDRDVKKENENPSIGILLCKDKDNEVVEYALNRNLSPTLIAEYQLLLPDKKFLQEKLHQFYIEFEQNRTEFEEY